MYRFQNLYGFTVDFIKISATIIINNQVAYGLTGYFLGLFINSLPYLFVQSGYLASHWLRELILFSQLLYSDHSCI